MSYEKIYAKYLKKHVRNQIAFNVIVNCNVFILKILFVKHFWQEKITSSLNELYETSKCYVSIGLASDEKGDKSLAVKHYVDALQCLEKVSFVFLSAY